MCNKQFTNTAAKMGFHFTMLNFTAIFIDAVAVSNLYRR